MSNAFNTIQAANNGITSITKLVQSAQALVSQAQQTSDTAVRTSLSTQFGEILTQIDQLAANSGFNGINLLDSTLELGPDRDAERNRHLERHRRGGRLQRRRRPRDQQRGRTTGAVRPTSLRPRPT